MRRCLWLSLTVCRGHKAPLPENDAVKPAERCKPLFWIDSYLMFPLRQADDSKQRQRCSASLKSVGLRFNEGLRSLCMCLLWWPLGSGQAALIKHTTMQHLQQTYGPPSETESFRFPNHFLQGSADNLVVPLCGQTCTYEMGVITVIIIIITCSSLTGC